jgi:hypothetical protein
VLLDHDLKFSFIINTSDQAEEVTYAKIGAPLPLN